MDQNIITIKIAGGGTFSAISIAAALIITPIVPRFPGWGIALIDPISIIWISCFLIFGLGAGLICSGAGFIALFYVDPFVPWGPIFKISATLPLIIIPYFLLKLGYGKNKNLGDNLARPKIYLLTVLPAVFSRCIIMVLANILFFIFIIGETAIISYGGLFLIALFALAINVEQSIWDLLIPWLIVYPTKIHQTYNFW